MLGREIRDPIDLQPGPGGIGPRTGFRGAQVAGVETEQRCSAQRIGFCGPAVDGDDQSRIVLEDEDVVRLPGERLLDLGTLAQRLEPPTLAVEQQPEQQRGQRDKRGPAHKIGRRPIVQPQRGEQQVDQANDERATRRVCDDRTACIQRIVAVGEHGVRNESTAEMSTIDVLIVDDDPRNCELLGRLLEMEGCRVRTASNAQSGLAMAAETAPDLVLMDVRMPGIDGFEACRRLRDTPVMAARPIFLVTAYDDDDVWPQAAAAGASGLLAKPYDRAALRRLLRGLSAPSPAAPGKRHEA